MDNKMIAKETKQNEVKHTRTFLIVGVSLIVIGIVMLVIKGMSPEYIDAEGILHERFYLVIFGFFFMLCGVLSCVKDHCPCQKACRYHGNCKECVAIYRAHQEHVPNCMRPLINKKLKIMSELTEHTLANEIEPPKEILRK